MRRFCYRCGALESEAGPLIGGLCQSCFLQTFRVNLPARVELTVCRSCGSFLIGGSWLRVPAEEALRSEILRSGGIPPGLEVEVSLSGDTAAVRITGRVDERQTLPLSIEGSVKVRQRQTTCRPCSLKRGGHYEAIVQLRGIPPAEAERILGQLQGDLLVSDKDFFARIDRLENGVDVYVSTVSLARRLSSALREMGAKVTSTSKLVGQTRDGRRRYRPTFLARFPGATDLSQRKQTEKG